MPKLKTDPLTQADLAAFAANDSDFAFEMGVLLQLQALGFQCEHSGTYEDPVTHKFRQFDIRANKDLGRVRLALAVECKNIRPHNPLLVSAVPRAEIEAFHDRIEFVAGTYAGGSSQRVAVRGPDSAYPLVDRETKKRQTVGKKIDQVGREDTKDAALVSDDSATFDKVQQAVNSCSGLVRKYGRDPQPPSMRVIVPVLVVPDGVLWQVDYNADGTVAKEPRTVTVTTLVLRQSWEFDRGDRLQVEYRISHLEIWTPAGVAARSAELANLLL